MKTHYTVDMIGGESARSSYRLVMAPTTYTYHPTWCLPGVMQSMLVIVT